MNSEQNHKASSSPRRVLPPALTVKRLSLYLRHLETLVEKGQPAVSRPPNAKHRVWSVSSRQLGKALGLTDAQVRKDLAWFGQFGRPGVGYPVGDLMDRLRSILGTNKVWDVAVVGVGSLGRALLRYKGFLKKGFRAAVAFDSAPGKIGKKFGGITVRPMSKLPSTVKKARIRLAILAVPAEAAQKVAELLCRAGIKGILNFAPVTLAVPPGVAVVPVDLAVQLEQLSYLVNASGKPKGALRQAQK